MSAAAQINFLLKLSCLSRNDLIKEITENYNNTSNDKLFCIKLIKQDKVERDSVVDIGREKAKRIYFDFLETATDSQNASTKYCSVGWVLGYDQKSCLLCFDPFSRYKKRPHHCRACGNLICSNCSQHRSLVQELESLGEVRVCNDCYNNSFIINNKNKRVINLFESIDSWGDVFITWDEFKPLFIDDENNEYDKSYNDRSRNSALFRCFSTYVDDEYFVDGCLNNTSYDLESGSDEDNNNNNNNNNNKQSP